MSDRVLVSVEKGIAKVKLNRSDKHNALDMAMFYAIDKTIKQLKSRRDVRVVIVSGEGQSFCSGLDLKSVMTNMKNGIKLLWKWLPGNANLAQRITVGWSRLKVPVIMVLHGKCWGGGMQVALGGDFRIAAKDCSLAVMESRWGLIPDMGGTSTLKQNLSLDKALKLAMTGEPVSAEEALGCNLITQVEDEPMQAALELAEILAQRSPDTNRAIKRFYHKAWCRKSRKMLAGETLNQWRILLGKNRNVAVKKARGDREVEYFL